MMPACTVDKHLQVHARPLLASLQTAAYVRCTLRTAFPCLPVPASAPQILS